MTIDCSKTEITATEEAYAIGISRGVSKRE